MDEEFMETGHRIKWGGPRRIQIHVLTAVNAAIKDPDNKIGAIDPTVKSLYMERYLIGRYEVELFRAELAENFKAMGDRSVSCAQVADMIKNGFEWDSWEGPK